MDYFIRNIELKLHWYHELDLLEFLHELRTFDYITSIDKSKTLLDYANYITYLEKPDIIAIKKDVRIGYGKCYNKSTMRIEGKNKENIKLVFNELIKILDKIDTNIDKNILYYEMICLYKVNNLKIKNIKQIKEKNANLQILSLDSFYNNPFSNEFVYIKLVPVFSCWIDDLPKKYDLFFICYCKNKNKILEFIESADNLVEVFIENISVG